MEACWSVYGLALLVLLVNLTADTLAKSVHHKRGHHANLQNKDMFTKKCDCRVETYEGQVLHDFGTIENYELPETSCHEVHHNCRRACAEKLNLEGFMEGRSTRGYHYCDAYGQTTPKQGVTLVAVWKPRGCPHHKEEDTLREAMLCCGHTTITLESGNHVKVFGWNKDCNAQSFVIGD